MIAGVTRARFPRPRVDEVVQDIQQEIVPLHEQQVRGQPGFRGAVFVVNRDTGEAIGITLWDDEQQLRAVEGTLGRDDPGAIRDPQRAPNEYTRRRAEAVRRRGGNMDESDLYEVAFEVRP